MFEKKYVFLHLISIVYHYGLQRTKKIKKNIITIKKIQYDEKINQSGRRDVASADLHERLRPGKGRVS